jgi:hypothetical protein
VAAHKYDIIDEHGTGAIALVLGLGTYTGAALDFLRYPNILVEADLSALTGTSPTAQLKIDSSVDNVTWGNGDVYSGPTYSAAVSHWGFRGSAAAGKRFVRIRVIVGGTGPSATIAITVLGAANA